MQNDNILQIAEANQRRAYEIIDELKIVETWKAFGAQANLIGSLPTGLLMKHRDIDFHIYSDRFSIADSFGAMTRLAQNERIKRITYNNLLGTEEDCLEWHAWYEDDDKKEWQIDMIHILKGSKYEGRMEQVVERIKQRLTPELRGHILSIKNDMPEDDLTMGIIVYMAVLRDGVKDFAEFTEWKKRQEFDAIIDWMP